ncbi:hypothetical protein CH296_18120 [Rhodococcus sp. 14-2496-1d]|nr:hypothetical protein CH296_18120 [Rhodococcus sp. 14-2496-1d]
MADLAPDLVVCCGRTFDRNTYSQCTIDGSDLCDIESEPQAVVPPPPDPRKNPVVPSPRTTLDPSGSRGKLRLVTCGTMLVLDAGQSLPVGRDDDYPTADVFRSRTNVSRYHAVIRFDGQRLLVTDTQSSNGTFVNDKKIPPDTEYEVRPGQKLRLAADVDIDIHWES